MSHTRAVLFSRDEAVLAVHQYFSRRIRWRQFDQLAVECHFVTIDVHETALFIIYHKLHIFTHTS